MWFIRSIFGLMLFCMCLNSTPALAEYPKKTIKLIVPFGPGGEADLCARFLTNALQPYFPKIIVTNMGSAGGVTGAAYVAAAKPDGYTLLLGWLASVSSSPAFYPEIPYSWDSFDYISMIQKQPYALVGNPKHDMKTYSDLIEALQNGRKGVSFATCGRSTLNYIAPELMLATHNIPQENTRFVPFKNGGQATTAVIGGHLDFFWQGVGPLVSPISGKQLNCLAVTSPERLAGLPECPTVRELGFPEMEQITSWGSIAGPKGLPAEVIEKWQHALREVAKDPKWIAALESMESTPAISTPEETRKFVEEQYLLYKDMNSK